MLQVQLANAELSDSLRNAQCELDVTKTANSQLQTLFTERQKSWHEQTKIAQMEHDKEVGSHLCEVAFHIAVLAECAKAKATVVIQTNSGSTDNWHQSCCRHLQKHVLKAECVGTCHYQCACNWLVCLQLLDSRHRKLQEMEVVQARFHTVLEKKDESHANLKAQLQAALCRAERSEAMFEQQRQLLLQLTGSADDLAGHG